MFSFEKHIKKVTHLFQERVVHTAQSMLAFTTQPNQAGLLEYLQLLGNRGLANPELLLKFSDTE
jgi:hypothetical protein